MLHNLCQTTDDILEEEDHHEDGEVENIRWGPGANWQQHPGQTCSTTLNVNVGECIYS